MKKKIVLAFAICAMAAVMTACGSKAPKADPTTVAAAESSTALESSDAADNKKETTAVNQKESERESNKAELATLDEKEAAGPGATLEEAEADSDNQNFADLENSDYAGFAKKVVAAVQAKDMNALADLIAYPAYISCAKENDGIVDSKAAFLALDKEEIFDETLVKAMAEADLSELEPLMAGVVIGDDTPNIIFNSAGGTLGITGINY